jgi:hypothetical protein
MTAPDWLTVGAPVVELYVGSPPRIVETTVRRIGKQRVTLDNGEQYSLTYLSKRHGGTWGGWETKLVPADAPEVGAARRKIRAGYLRDAAVDAAERCRKAPTAETARAVLAALDGGAA